MVVYTTCKKAIARWEKETGDEADKAKVVELMFQWPPLEKMDKNLSRLQACEKLSLSSNMIDEIAGLSKLNNLKCLSLARNNIRALDGIEVVRTLEELCISYNFIEKLKGVESLRNLKRLYISHNLISEWSEYSRLKHCEDLEDLVMVGNPLYYSHEQEMWRIQARARLISIQTLDGLPVKRNFNDFCFFTYDP